MLYAGDKMTFDPDAPHRFRVSSDEVTEVFAAHFADGTAAYLMTDSSSLIRRAVERSRDGEHQRRPAKLWGPCIRRFVRWRLA